MPTGDEVLAAFAPLLAAVAQRDRDSAALGTERLAAEQKFLADFARACETEVKPAMEAVLQRLRQLGGDALVEEHPGGEARFTKPRIALWMSLEGEVGVPRLDRHPYLLLEAEVQARKVQVDEGDMWRGAGGNSSGRVGKWDVSELTRDRVLRELLAIVQRAVN
ncbi:MAG: hypothetical protein ACYCXN_04825 [Acidimicrobiales bacterium]